MIALAQAEDHEILYGAVTIGNVWQFGCLDVRLKRIVQMPTLYRVPEDIKLRKHLRIDSSKIPKHFADQSHIDK